MSFFKIISLNFTKKLQYTIKILTYKKTNLYLIFGYTVYIIFGAIFNLIFLNIVYLIFVLFNF